MLSIMLIPFIYYRNMYDILYCLLIRYE